MVIVFEFSYVLFWANAFGGVEEQTSHAAARRPARRMTRDGPGVPASIHPGRGRAGHLLARLCRAPTRSPAIIRAEAATVRYMPNVRTVIIRSPETWGR